MSCLTSYKFKFCKKHIHTVVYCRPDQMNNKIVKIKLKIGRNELGPILKDRVSNEVYKEYIPYLTSLFYKDKFIEAVHSVRIVS